MPCNLISSCFFLESPWSRDQVIQGVQAPYKGIQAPCNTGGYRDQVIQGPGTIQGGTGTIKGEPRTRLYKRGPGTR